MKHPVSTTRQGAVLLVTIDNPPVNALSREVLAGLDAAVVEAAGSEEIEAVVLMGAGATFVAGADIRTFPAIARGEEPMVDYNATFNRIEDLGKPVVAALHGTPLGGGLELAMACHYRIAAAKTALGQPEVKLGLIPGAGGTQRLPRLVGVARALEMCALGESIGVEEAAKLGLVDEIAQGDLTVAAVEFAGRAGSPRRTRDLGHRLVAPEEGESLAALVRETAGKKMKQQTAPLAALDAVLAACRLSFNEGLAAEARLFEECLRGPQAAALIHAFFAGRAVSKVSGVDRDTQWRAIERAAVVGAGTMGRGIATAFLSAGIPVSMTDADPDALERGRRAVEETLAGLAAKGRLDPAKAGALSACESLDEAVSKADLVIEAVFEDTALKRTVFAAIDQAAPARALLASNTSTLDIDELAAVTKRPWSVAGLHFFSPAHVMKLVEIVRGLTTAPETLATALAVAKRLRKTAVVSGNRYGFIGNRMFMPYREQAVEIATQGATPVQVDEALTAWGMAMGPLAVGDLSGLDVFSMMRREALRAGFHFEAETFEDLLCNQGRKGQKAGAGWYLYDAKRKAFPDPDLEPELREYAAARGVTLRNWTGREIRERTLSALINEGARLLEDGVAERASDLDVVYMDGYGFPSWRGGPMHTADVIGSRTILNTLERLYGEEGPFWKPSQLLVECARTGRSLAGWTRFA
jgi:3-hydroxyacyl-CoA dehydrogenase